MCEIREFSEAGSNSVIIRKLQIDRMSKLKRNPLIDPALTTCITQFTLPHFKAGFGNNLLQHSGFTVAW